MQDMHFEEKSLKFSDTQRSAEVRSNVSSQKETMPTRQ